MTDAKSSSPCGEAVDLWCCCGGGRLRFWPWGGGGGDVLLGVLPPLPAEAQSTAVRTHGRRIGSGSIAHGKLCLNASFSVKNIL